MDRGRKLDLQLRLNAVSLRLRDAVRRVFPWTLDPRFIRAVALETTTACTRSCPYCPPHSAMRIPKLLMSRETFSRVVSSLGGRGFSGDIFFSLYGESLADDRLESLVAEAKKKAPGARTVVFTNGDLLTAGRFLDLKKAGMDRMSVSLHSEKLPDGPAAALARLGRDYPELYSVEVIDYYTQSLPGNDSGLLNNKGGLAEVRRRPFHSCCDIESACVDCLGNVPLCNNDCTGSYIFGNVNERDFYDIWEDPLFMLARRRILRGERVFEICRRCMSCSGRTTRVPEGAAERLPPAFSDMQAALERLRAEAGLPPKGSAS